MNNDDIVTRLRNHIAITTRVHYSPKDGYPEPVMVHGPSPICQEAADEIERLREQLRLANIDNFNTTAEVERLRKENNDLKEIVALQGEVVKLAQKRQEERDEARREVCCFHHLTGFLSGDYAISRGWDCYKNYSGEGFPPSVTDFEEFLKEQDQIWLDRVDRLTKERDEARREVCEADTDTHGGALLEAERRGWDCFKEEQIAELQINLKSLKTKLREIE